MLAQKSKWNDLLSAMHTARRYARTLEERENRDRRYGLLIFLVAICLVGFLLLLAEKLHWGQ